MGQKCTYESSILPLPLGGKGEMEWPNAVRVPLYIMGLGWTFLGIAVISDIFMAGIEKVTSLKKRVKDKKTGRTITIHVWNDTVANLTLMALGSSAPEILLSVIEICTNDMFLGDLGAGTIVGSAAFNLLCISAVCVSSLPDNEVRFIKEVHVYIITASCSIFAYLWLMFVLMAPPSPNVCETWEAVLTLLFFPILVTLAYMADRGYFQRSTEDGGEKQEKEMLQVIPDNVTKDEIVQITQQIRDSHPKGAQLTHDEVIGIMNTKYFTQRSRAYYRRIGLKGDVKPTNGPPELSVSTAVETGDELEALRAEKHVVLGFACARYAFIENCVQATVTLTREGLKNTRASVKFKTRDGTAKAGDGKTGGKTGDGGDYEHQEGTIVFEKEETEKKLSIKIHDDNAYEENEEFYVDLSEPQYFDDSGTCQQAHLGSNPTVTVVIIDDDEPGIMKFKEEELQVEEGVEQTDIEVVVLREGGASGKISCSYRTEDMTAIAGIDYVEAKGTVEFDEAVQSCNIPITICAKGRFEKTSGFNVVLEEPKGSKFDGKTDGGEERCICHVKIIGQKSAERMTLIRKMESRINSEQALMGRKKWRQQFYDAVFQVVEDEGEDEGEEGEDAGGPSKLDYVLHIVSVPWKALFAFVPPVDYCGGWGCFFGALVMIAVVTAIVGDMANLVGCTMNINPEITAITFVALGTSLPDTFASKAAAVMDPYADASIGNVTGSNSVNVFLGLGLSWSLAAFYWEFSEPSKDWLAKLAKVGNKKGVYYDVREDVQKVMRDGKAVFVVPAGSLWFNLMVFSVNALLALQHLYMRRRKFGGELGGPKNGFMGQYFSAGFLFFQWLIYITASSIFATLKESD